MVTDDKSEDGNGILIQKEAHYDHDRVRQHLRDTESVFYLSSLHVIELRGGSDLDVLLLGEWSFHLFLEHSHILHQVSQCLREGVKDADSEAEH